MMTPKLKSAAAVFAVTTGLMAAGPVAAGKKHAPAPLPLPAVHEKQHATTSDDDLRTHYADQIRAPLPMLAQLVRDHALAKTKTKPARKLTSATWTMQETMRSYYGVAVSALPSFEVNGRLDRKTAAALVKLGRAEGIEQLFIDGWNGSLDEANHKALRDHIAKTAPDEYAAGLRLFVTEQAREKAVAEHELCMTGATRRVFTMDYLTKEAKRLKAEDNYTTSAMPVRCLASLNALPLEQKRSSQLRYLTERLATATNNKEWCAAAESETQVSSESFARCYEHNL